MEKDINIRAKERVLKIGLTIIIKEENVQFAPTAEFKATFRLTKQSSRVDQLSALIKQVQVLNRSRQAWGLTLAQLGDVPLSRPA